MTEKSNSSQNAADTINDISEGVDQAAGNDLIVAALEEKVAKGPYWLRNTAYYAGIVIGAIALFGAPTIAMLPDDAKVVGIAIVGLAASLAGLLAKLNINKPKKETM